VKVENSLAFAAALRAHGVPFDLHIYQHGPHGIALGGPWNEPEKLHPWTRDCLYWLKLQQFIK
jgi:dipeptidyl aminopeptidase/acylaminoacyl peptidase